MHKVLEYWSFNFAEIKIRTSVPYINDRMKLLPGDEDYFHFDDKASSHDDSLDGYAIPGEERSNRESEKSS